MHSNIHRSSRINKESTDSNRWLCPPLIIVFLKKQYFVIVWKADSKTRSWLFGNMSEQNPQVLQWEVTKHRMARLNLGQPSGGWPLALWCLSQFIDQKIIKCLINRAKRNLVSKNARTLNRCLFFYLYLPPTWDISGYFFIPLPNKLTLPWIRDI